MTASRILVVDDESDIRRLIQEILSEEGYAVTVAGNAAQARSAMSADGFDLVLLDIWMPDTDGISLLREWSEGDLLKCPVVMMSGHGTVDTAVEATRLGAADFIEKPLSLTKLLRTVERALEEGEKPRGRKGRTQGSELLAPVGRSRTMQMLRDHAQRVAPHDAPVMILGEPGSGREAFARHLHAIGPRATGPLVAVVAASLTDDTAATQLYGTVTEPGLLARASGGVLFIQDVPSLGAVAQALLHSALEQRGYTPQGGTRREPLDIRLLVSAPPDFEARHEGFRQDLYSHLSVLTLRVPPLRDYAEDVPDLLRYYIDRLIDAERLPLRRFSIAAQNRLRNYPWPGNIRELRNLVHRLLILGGDDEISLAEIEAELEVAASASEPLVKQDLLAMPLREAREHFERAYLQEQLQLCGGKVGQLAKRVGMERTHLYRKLRSLGVDFRQSPDD
jgi:two-component system, NtrC family, nitrogen regulation response regulator NtrX